MNNIKSYFIRPQRQTYQTHDLGPPVYFYAGLRIHRTDFSITNDSGYQLQVSLFENDLEKLSSNCVIYLHTHHGSRLEGLPLVNRIIKDGANVCLLDFAGYGVSEGTNVTLGFMQKFDVRCLIRELKRRNQKKFVLWGRSMGAVTALLFNQSFPNQIVASVYDSPFNSLERLTLQLAEKVSGVPQLIIKPIVEILKLSMLSDLNFGELELNSRVGSIKTPAYFITSKNDTFLNSSHSQTLYSNYGGNKQLLFIDQDHNQARKDSDLKPIFSFIKTLFSKSAEKSGQLESILLNNLKVQVKQRCKTSYSINSAMRGRREYQF